MDSELIEIMSEAFDEAAQQHRPGGEFWWFACDKALHVAVFCTAGFGYVPNLVLKNKEAYLSLFTWIACTAKPCSLVETEKTAPKSMCTNLVEEIEFAEKGLFYYDNLSAMNKPYQRILIPRTPIVIDDIPQEHRSYLCSVTLTDTLFAFSNVIEASEHWKCM